MRVRRLLLLLPLLLALGCPPEQGSGGGGPVPPTGGPQQGGPQDPGPQDPGSGSTPPGDAPAPAASAPWQLIPPETVKQMEWPMLDPVATWPAPESLVPPELSPAAKDLDPARVRALEEVVRRVVAASLRPTDPQAAIGIDAQGRLHMKLGKGKAMGSATLASHPSSLPPTFAFAFTTNEPAAKTIEALREQVARVVSKELADELKQKTCRLEPHPKGTPGVGLAFLDRHGFGERFPYLYAFSGERRLVVVMHEVPHMSLDAKADPTPR